MDAPFEYVFPAIRGVQAHREYFISMCPLRLLPKIFLFDEEELVPELRAQRTLNKNRIPEISRYILDNRDNYVFSAITASIDGEVRFEPFGTSANEQRVGLLHIPMSARFIINDGQHRRAAIEMALRENPELADESIAVVLFLDLGLERCQQMFADLNRHAIRPSKSLGVLYDYRDEKATLAKLVVFRSSVFRDVVEMERSALSARSRKLFTLSAIYTATSALLMHSRETPLEERAALAVAFWEEVAKQIPEWQLVRERKMSATEVRRDFIHSHGIALQALGTAGNILLQNGSAAWKRQLRRLKRLDWSRSNAKLWEGRAMIGGRVSKASHNVVLTTNVLKDRLCLSLTPEEQRVEDAFLRGDYARS
jgi:DNA sulfur modification protein DndB